MTNSIRSLSLGTTFGVLSALLSPALAVPGAPNPGSPQEIIIRLHAGESIQAINAAYETRALRADSARNTFLLDLPAGASAQALENRLRHDPRVAWAEQNHAVIAPRASTQSFFLPTNFSIYTGQYAMDKVKADASHGISTGAGQVVAVLDTGVDPAHELIAGRIAVGGYNFIDDNDDFAESIEEGQDPAGTMVGHGTMVAGVVLRVAPSAFILPMRVLDASGVGTSYHVAQAIYSAVDAGASVINLSLGTTHPSQAIAEAVQSAHDAGVVVIATAGNTNRESPAFYPAAFEPVIAVAGTDAADQKAPFSDFGQHIDLAAPALSIVGTFPRSAYASSDGNSFATAIVSGAAAVLRAHTPAATPADLRIQLRLTADDIDDANPQHAGLLGSGRLNIQRALTE